MAIAFDAATDGGYHDDSTSAALTFAHTCSGDNRVLLVGTVGNGWADPEYITGVTYNGVAMTLVTYHTSGFGLRRSSVWILVNPPTGTHNVVITLSNSQYIFAGAVSYSGLTQLSEPNAYNVGTGSTLALTTAVTTTVDGCWLVCFDQAYPGPITPYDGVRRVQDVISPYNTWGFFDTNGQVGTAGVHNFSTTASACLINLHIVVALGGEAGPPPQVGGSIPTICDPTDPAGGPDPVGTLPPWSASCDAGGVVDSVADLTDGEAW